MRLGAYAAVIKPGTFIYESYKKTGRIKADRTILKSFKKDPANRFRLGTMSKSDIAIVERHRHRYEVNPEYIDKLTENGLVFSGYHTRDDGTELMEFIEIPGHRCFIATQAHPEFTSRLGRPNPMFLSFLTAAEGDVDER